MQSYSVFPHLSKSTNIPTVSYQTLHKATLSSIANETPMILCAATVDFAVPWPSLYHLLVPTSETFFVTPPEAQHIMR